MTRDDIAEMEKVGPVVEPNVDQLTQILNGLDHCFTRESKREFLRTWIRDFAQHAAPAIPDSWKDHNTAELVNELRDIAIKYRDMQQLRERIAHVIRPLADRLYAVPEGWQLVPKEPTPEMIRSGQSEYGEVVFAEHQVNSVYRDMLAAAPEYKP